MTTTESYSPAAIVAMDPNDLRRLLYELASSRPDGKSPTIRNRLIRKAEKALAEGVEYRSVLAREGKWSVIEIMVRCKQ